MNFKSLLLPLFILLFVISLSNPENALCKKKSSSSNSKNGSYTVKYYKDNPIQLNRIDFGFSFSKSQLDGKNYYKAYFKGGKLVSVVEYDNKMIVETVKLEYVNDSLARITYYYPNGKVKKYTEVKTDSKGNVIEAIAFDSKGIKRFSKGIDKIRYVLKKNGKVSEARYVNSKDELQENKHGVAILKYYYDKNGRIKWIVHYDKDLKKLSKGICNIKFEYDKYNNIIRITYTSKDNRLQPNTSSGAAIIEYDYNKNHRVTEKRLFNEYKKPLKNGVARYKYVYDNDGRLVKIASYGSNNNLIKEEKVNRKKRRGEKSSDDSEKSDYDKLMDKLPASSMVPNKNMDMKLDQKRLPKRDPKKVLSVYLEAWKRLDYDAMYLLTSERMFRETAKNKNKGKHDVDKRTDTFRMFVSSMRNNNMYLASYNIISGPKFSNNRREASFTVELVIYYGYMFNKVYRDIVVGLEGRAWKVMR